MFDRVELLQVGQVQIQFFSLTPVCHNILIPQANYAFPCSTYGCSTQSTWSNDVAANLHCVNTKWVIWKRCWHVDLVIKPNAFTYWVNASVRCDVHPYVRSLSKKQNNSPTRRLGHLTLTGPMKKSLSPWPAAINSISHSSPCLSFLSFFRQIHLHERPLIPARWPPGKWESNQRFDAILPSPSYVRRNPKAVVSVLLINLPLSHDWRDQHVLIILPWFELDHPCLQMHKYSTSQPAR